MYKFQPIVTGAGCSECLNFSLSLSRASRCSVVRDQKLATALLQDVQFRAPDWQHSFRSLAFMHKMIRQCTLKVPTVREKVHGLARFQVTKLVRSGDERRVNSGDGRIFVYICTSRSCLTHASQLSSSDIIGSEIDHAKRHELPHQYLLRVLQNDCRMLDRSVEVSNP